MSKSEYVTLASFIMLKVLSQFYRTDMFWFGCSTIKRQPMKSVHLRRRNSEAYNITRVEYMIHTIRFIDTPKRIFHMQKLV